ncbi:aspartic proteinase Asp1 isoform X3 [Momordica charantia]|uniref:Aspartic proteinase Asp1 isoform X3 n=1 Tax=Momordica charantia TaxID=3673 RepID=A0A6J1DU28_MOMCH|nr:aspartic proteinase Asp1 isoform X3 [Momordica charantia]
MGTGLLKILVLMVASMNCLAPSSASSFFKDKPWERRKPILSVSATSSSFASSSIVLPLQGNVYPNGKIALECICECFSEFYNVTLYVGQPPKPYFLDPDTGSDLTWLQCDAPCQQCTETPHPLYRPSDDLVPCKDPLCMSLHSSVDHRCENPDQCDYEVEYADGGSSLGVLVRDIFPLNLTNGDPIRPRLALGCGYDQIPGSSYYHPMDGILGLGKGAVSIVSQLHNQGIIRNVIGHCFSSRGGGYLFFGDDIYDSHRVVWTPMSRDYPKHYSPGLGELIFNGRSTGLRNLFAVFDSGSSYTYFNAQAYQVLTSLLNRELAGKPLREAMDDDTLPLCWRGRKPFKSLRDVRKYFKPLALSFSSGGRSKAVFEIPMEGYLILSSMGNVCLGILNGTEVGLQNSNIIGGVDIRTHDFLIGDRCLNLEICA